MIPLLDALKVRLVWQDVAIPLTGQSVFRRTDVAGGVLVEVFRTAAGYLVHAWEAITVELLPEERSFRAHQLSGLDDALRDHILTNSVLPLVGQLLGIPVFHGSAVAIGGKAIGLLGASGCGKSTLAAVLVDSGARLIADDCLVIRETSEGLALIPTASGVRLRLDPEQHWRRKKGIRAPDGKVIVPLETCAEPVPLGALCQLDVAEEPKLTELRPRDATIALATNLFRLDPKREEFMRQELCLFERLVAATSVRRFAYPRRIDSIDSVAKLLIAAAKTWL